MELIFRINPSAHHLVKQLPRAIGCSEITTPTYSSGGIVFDIQCNMYWPYAADIYTTFTVDFSTCIAQCVKWNTAQSDKCVGVTWAVGLYGPNGAAGGSQCFLLWQLGLNSIAPAGFDSATIQGSPLVQSSLKNLLTSR